MMDSRVLAIVTILVVAACGDDGSAPTDAGDSSTAGSSAGSGANTGDAGAKNVIGGSAAGPGAACVTCVTTSCAANIQTCTSDADCLSIMTCTTPCADEACYEACIAQHPDAGAAFEPLMACLQASCSTDCGLS